MNHGQHFLWDCFRLAQCIHNLACPCLNSCIVVRIHYWIEFIDKFIEIPYKQLLVHFLDLFIT